MTTYEQEVTIVLSQSEATSLSVALQEYLRYITRDLQSSPTYTKGEELNPNSCMGSARKLIHNLDRVACGDRSPSVAKQVAYKMVLIAPATQQVAA